MDGAPPPFPRRGSWIYSLISEDREEAKRALDRWRAINKYVVVPLYRIRLLPLMGMGRLFLLLSTVGRRTGRTRYTPLEYKVRDGMVHVFVARGEEADWFRNMVADPRGVRVQLGFGSFKPEIEVLNDEAEIKEILRWYVRENPRSAMYLFGWDPKVDDVETADLSPFASMMKIVLLRRPGG